LSLWRVVSWNSNKTKNACVIATAQVSITFIKDYFHTFFSIPMIIFQTFQGLKNVQNIFQTFPGSVQTLGLRTRLLNHYYTRCTELETENNSVGNDQEEVSVGAELMPGRRHQHTMQSVVWLMGKSKSANSQISGQCILSFLPDLKLQIILAQILNQSSHLQLWKVQWFKVRSKTDSEPA